MAGNRDKLGSGSEIVYDWSAFQEVRNSSSDLVAEAAGKLVGRANSYPSPAPTKRYGWQFHGEDAAVVFPDTMHAANSNAKHNTLVKVMGGGGL